MENNKNHKQLENWKTPIRNPARDGLIVGFALFFLSAVTIVYFYQRVVEVHEAQLRTDLTHISQIASVLIDPELHKTFKSAEQESSPEYQRITEKLRRIQKTVPQIKYIYTTRLFDDEVRFVLDAALPGDMDKDGVEDHSSIMDIYEEPDESLVQTLRTGQSQASKKPYTDKWGTFISASTPIFDDSRQLVGALAVDMKADDFLRQKQIITWLAELAVGVVFFISLTMGGIVYLLKRTSLRAECERIQGLQVLIESQERFKSLVANVPGVVYRCANDAHWTMEYLSPAIESMTGYKASDFLENKVRSFTSIIHPEDVAMVNQKVEEGIRYRKPYTLEYRMIHSDGQILWVYEQGKAFYDQDGKALWLDGTILDITAQKRAEDLVRSSDAKLRKITNAIPGAVYQYELKADGGQRFVFVSKGIEDIMEVTRHEALEDFNSVWGLVLPEDVEMLQQSIRLAARLLEPWECTFRIRTKSGKVKWIRGSSIPELEHQENAGIWNGILLDVSESKNMEQELLQSQKMETIGTLAGGVAHDLNNQLTPIVGYINLLLQKTPVSDPDHAILTLVHESAIRCTNSIKRLLNFSRPSLQQKEWLSPYQLLNDTRSLLKKLLPSSIETKIDCTTSVWPVEGNETDLQAVLLNLAANARDAMPQGGCLDVKVENLGLNDKENHFYAKTPSVLITVSDTGMGIPKEILQRIFEPFFTTKPKGVGTGLGLAMVFKTMADHKGYIDVSSEVGKGTVFKLYFPANPKAETGPRFQCVQGIPDEIKSSGETVLFADDEELVRNLGKTLLEKLGYRVVTAADGEEAAKIYQEHYKDIKIIMLDMTMPKLSGKQCLKKLLKINPTAKILLASGYTNEGLPQELIADGASGFLSKPYDIISMGNELKTILKAA